MLYSNCKQTIRPGNRPTAMQRLTRGSVICFGSAVGGEFCADTILVVASAEPWTPADTTIGQLAGEAFGACTADSLASGNGSYAETRLTLYRGATIDDPIDGMYSFVPALPADGGYPRFARPPIRLRWPDQPGQHPERDGRQPTGRRRRSATHGKLPGTRCSPPASFSPSD